jgi:hypothetical protein
MPSNSAAVTRTWSTAAVLSRTSIVSPTLPLCSSAATALSAFSFGKIRDDPTVTGWLPSEDGIARYLPASATTLVSCNVKRTRRENEIALLKSSIERKALLLRAIQFRYGWPTALKCLGRRRRR